MERIKLLCDLLQKEKVSAFILPNTDEFQSEYLPEHSKRVEWLTGFTGSAATVIVTQYRCAFFTDGRYVLQAKQELGVNKFEIYDTKYCKPQKWLQDNNVKKLYYDPALHTEKQIELYKGIKLFTMAANPVDTLWHDKPRFIQSKIKNHEVYAGENSLEKCKRLAGNHPFFFSAPDSICWLLNIRGSDVRYNPLLFSYAVLYSQGNVDLFLQSMQDAKFETNVNIYTINELEQKLRNLKKIELDPNFTAMKWINVCKSGSIIRKNDPCQLAKACKNIVELEGAKRAHVRDGIAVTKFLHWVKSNKCTERSAANKLLEFRKEQDLFQEPSFATISAFGSHGAIIHYTACDDTPIEGDNFYLVDSGGQYLDGTTDVTRTIAIGRISERMKQDYSLVLKGFIAFAKVVFPRGTTGRQLDVLARQYLWRNHINYNHGTGHGVGSYLGVHEGPQSMNNDVPLEVGMIISNEPGCYRKGEYGIRIENLMHVVDMGNSYLGFKQLTRVAIELSCADLSLLTEEEINWVERYNVNIIG